MRRSLRPWGLALSALAVSSLAFSAQESGAPADAVTAVASYQQPLPPLVVAKSSKASRLASLSASQCWAELSRRKLTGVTRFKGAKAGVAAPVRLTGPINGVRFLTPGAKSPYGVLDCRLAVSLAELAQVLRRHDVIEVRVDNMYRPRARLPGKRKPSQHSYGLAIDMTRFKLADGSELVIERDFEGAIGEPVCGAGARAELSKAAAQLRDLICDVARSELFHHILTPNHDAAHRDHFHLDIARGARQRIIE
jgi:hypothetical protein